MKNIKSFVSKNMVVPRLSQGSQVTCLRLLLLCSLLGVKSWLFWICIIGSQEVNF